jgi:hypothetical protein
MQVHGLSACCHSLGRSEGQLIGSDWYSGMIGGTPPPVQAGLDPPDAI